MKKRVLGAVLLSVIVLLSGCKKSSMKESTAYDSASGSASNFSGQSNSVKGEAPNAPSSPTAAAGNTTVKKIIQTGDIRILVDDLKKTSADIRSKTEEIGGYIESENLNELTSSARVRIPSDKMTTFIGFIEEKFEVEGKNTANQDITDVYVDNDARLKNMKAQEAQYQEIMKSAKTIDEILKVQNELFRVRGEIEALEAKKNNWDRDVSFSTLTITARKQQLAIESKLRILKGSEFGKAIANGFTRSIVSITLFIQKFIIFVLSNIIQLILLALAAFVGIKIYKKYLKGKI